jgi:ADP-heptose:LPS heptosyltransferase
MYKSILISSGTNISEVVLSLPLISNIVKNMPNALVYFLVRKDLYGLLADNPFLEGIILYEETYPNFQSIKALSLVKKIKNLNIDIALVLYNNKELLKFLKKAGVKNIFGTYNNISDLLNYKNGIWQHREKAKKHELEYNLDLLKLINIPTNKITYDLKIPISNDSVIKFKEKLNNLKIKEKYIVISPLSGNEKCFNWRLSYYSELASRIISKYKLAVVYIGDKIDEQIINTIHKHTVGEAYNLVEKLDLKEIICLIAKASLYIGPKCGYTHLATATNTQILTFFNNNKVLSNKRYGPYNTSYNRILIPNGDCPGNKKCLNTRCNNFYCMDSINIEEVIDKVDKILNNNEIDQMSLDFKGRLYELQ